MPNSSAVPADGRLPDGRHFSQISPMGYVPAIETRGGFVLTEGPAVLTYIAELAPEGSLASPAFRTRITACSPGSTSSATELHKAVFTPLIGKTAGPEERGAALVRVAKPFGVLSRHLEGQGVPRRPVHRRRRLSAERAQLVRVCGRADRRLAGAARLAHPAARAAVGGARDGRGMAAAPGRLRQAPGRAASFRSRHTCPLRREPGRVFVGTPASPSARPRRCRPRSAATSPSSAAGLPAG